MGGIEYDEQIVLNFIEAITDIKGIIIRPDMSGNAFWVLNLEYPIGLESRINKLCQKYFGVSIRGKTKNPDNIIYHEGLEVLTCQMIVHLSM